MVIRFRKERRADGECKRAFTSGKQQLGLLKITTMALDNDNRIESQEEASVGHRRLVQAKDIANLVEMAELYFL